MQTNEKTSKLKKAKNIPVLENGNIIKKNNVNKIDLEKVIFEIEKQNKMKLIPIEKNIYKFSYTIFIFKPFSRGHLGTGDYNENEKFRSRYTKTDVLKWRKYYEAYGYQIIFVSYYSTIDKIITIFSDITSVIFTKKSKISSDSRISNIGIHQLKKVYDSNRLFEVLEAKSERTNPRFLVGSTTNKFLEMLKGIESGEIELPIYKNNNIFEDDVEILWLKSSFNQIKNYIEKKDMNKFTGELGEFITFISLIKKFTKNIIWESKLNSRSSYDMSYKDEKYWEVKSTRENNNLINISQAEKSFAESNLNKWSLIRVSLKEFIADVDFNQIDKFEVLEKIVESWLESNMISIQDIPGELVIRKDFKPTGYRIILD